MKLLNRIKEAGLWHGSSGHPCLCDRKTVGTPLPAALPTLHFSFLPLSVPSVFSVVKN